MFDILGAAFPHPGAIEVKFCTAKQTHVPVGPAQFDMNRCNESPLGGEKPDFWPVSKFNTGSLPLCGILPVKTQLRTKTSSHERQCIPAGYCHAHMLLCASGVYYNVNSKYSQYIAQLCGRIFTFSNISTTN